MSEVENKKPHPLSKEAKAARESAKQNEVISVETMGEETKEITFEEKYGLPIIDPNKSYEFELITYKKEQAFPNVSLIYDKVEKRQRYIRYVKGESSIFEDEQAETPTGRKYSCEIGFREGVNIVSGADRNMVLFLMLHDENLANTHKTNIRNRSLFKQVDRQAEAKERLEKQVAKEKAMGLAIECSFQEMLEFACVMGIEVSNAKEREYEIRDQFINRAAANPSWFLNNFNNPKNKRKYLVMEAFRKGVITDLHIKGQVHWNQSKVHIVTLPLDVDTIEYLTDISFSDKYKEFVDNLKKMV